MLPRRSRFGSFARPEYAGVRAILPCFQQTKASRTPAGCKLRPRNLAAAINSGGDDPGQPWRDDGRGQSIRAVLTYITRRSHDRTR